MYAITDQNDEITANGGPNLVSVDMEEKFCSVTLDIIGQGS